MMLSLEELKKTLTWLEEHHYEVVEMAPYIQVYKDRTYREGKVILLPLDGSEESEVDETR